MRPDRLSQRRVPAHRRGEGLGARSRLHLRRRRVRAHPRLRAPSRSVCRSISRACSAASTASASPIRTPTREWSAIIAELVAKQPFDDQGVYFQVTRGVAKRDHAFPQGVAPTVFMMSNPLATPPAEQVERGVAVVTAEDNRWRRCDLKTISLVGNVLMRQLAADAGCGRDGDVPRRLSDRGVGVERADRAATATIVAPPKDNLILPGITYDATEEFAREAGLPFEMRAGDEGRGACRRRDVALVVDEGGARRDDGRRQAVRRSAFRDRTSARCTRSSSKRSAGPDARSSERATASGPSGSCASRCSARGETRVPLRCGARRSRLRR